MLRIYTFANALRLLKKIKYPLPEEEGYDINSISLPAWTDLVHQYVYLQRDKYTTEDMLKSYINGTIKLIYTLPELIYKNDVYTIYSSKMVPFSIGRQYFEIHGTNRILQGFLKDNAIYTRSNSWFIAKDDKLVAVDTLFYFEDMAAWYRRNFDDIESLRFFIDFCLNVIGLWRLYRLTPVDEQIPISYNAIESIGDYNRVIWGR